jgi:hypothetical protein
VWRSNSRGDPSRISCSPEINNCDFNQDGKPDPGLICNGKTNYVLKFNWSAGASYDFHLSSGAKFARRVDVYGQAETCSGVTVGLNCAPGSKLANARLQWMGEQGGWTAAPGGTNVGNKKYLLNTFDLTAFGQNTIQGARAAAAMGPPAVADDRPPRQASIQNIALLFAAFSGTG